METLAIGLLCVFIIVALGMNRILKELRAANAQLAKQIEFLNYIASAHLFDDGAELTKDDKRDSL